MKIKLSILTGFVFTLINFTYFLITSELGIAIFISVFILFVSPFLFYFKIFSQIDITTFKKIDKSILVYSGKTNHFIDRQLSIGGTLYLLNDRLIFQTNMLSFIRRHETTIMLTNIAEVNCGCTYGLINNELIIKTKDFEFEKFVVNKKETWKGLIEKEIHKQDIINTNR